MWPHCPAVGTWTCFPHDLFTSSGCVGFVRTAGVSRLHSCDCISWSNKPNCMISVTCAVACLLGVVVSSTCWLLEQSVTQMIALYDCGDQTTAQKARERRSAERTPPSRTSANTHRYQFPNLPKLHVAQQKLEVLPRPPDLTSSWNGRWAAWTCSWPGICRSHVPMWTLTEPQSNSCREELRWTWEQSEALSCISMVPTKVYECALVNVLKDDNLTVFHLNP